MILPNPLDMFDIRGRVALTAWAFGSVAARVLAGAGCRLVLAAECRSGGAAVLEVSARPLSAAACADMVARAVAAFGALDILVVASGMNKVAKIDARAPDDFASVMAANVTQSWLLARAATVEMKRHGSGNIVLVSSARGPLGHPAGYSADCASKAAVDGMTTALGCELGPLGITVNAISPTVFRSPLTAWMFENTVNARAKRAVGRAG